MRRLLLWIVIGLPLVASAHHNWGGIDLCEVYRDRLPPGLTRADLPEPASAGAVLLDRYCTQCHNLPGPDRHHAGEWRELLPKMFLLMDVSHRFGGLMGRVERLPEPDQARLRAYLERHAKPESVRPTAPGSESVPGAATPPPNGSIVPGPTRFASRLWSLFPFALLAGLGLFRWWRRAHHHA